MMPELMNCPHLPNGWCLTCLQAMIPRATVVAALAALRKEIDGLKAQAPIYAENAVRDFLSDAIERLDNTIAALNLAHKEGQ